jgi:hypothetical protein
MPGLSNAIHCEFLSASRDLEYHVHFSQFLTKNEHAIVKFWKPQQIPKVSHSLHQISYVKNFEALSLAISEKLDSSFLMNWLLIRLYLRLNIVQFQKERYSLIRETELFLLRPVPEKSET